MCRDGLIIAVLSLAPMRKRSVANLRISKHLSRVACAVTTIQLDESQTKNQRAIKYPLIPELEPYLADYLTRYRRVFVGACSHDALWTSVKGCPLSGNAIYDAVCRRTKAAFGRAMNLHLFRDAAATSLAIHTPAQVRAAADLLGHSSFAPTQRHYIRAQGVTAGRMLAEAVRLRVLMAPQEPPGGTY
jgi:integrase